MHHFAHKPRYGGQNLDGHGSQVVICRHKPVATIAVHAAPVNGRANPWQIMAEPVLHLCALEAVKAVQRRSLVVLSPNGGRTALRRCGAYARYGSGWQVTDEFS
jgi:hypothetical protein